MKQQDDTKSLEAWLSYLKQQHTAAVDLGLERISQLAINLQLAQFDCPVITIAGTNGKGSCVKLLESLYVAAGYRVGAYSSPHLLCFNERIRFNGQDVGDEQLIQAFTLINNARDKQQPISFFEFTTLAALALFRDAALDVLILEIGLGGRLDAVNIVDPDVAIVTTIGLDHMDWLGGDRESIGKEKAGIFRPNKPAICGDLDPPASIKQTAETIGSQLYQINHDFHYHVNTEHWQFECGATRYLDLPMPHLNIQNAAISLMATTLLQEQLPITLDVITKTIGTVTLAGRFQQCRSPVPCIFDVAHNAESAVWLAEQIKAHPISGKTLAVFSMLNDKPLKETITPLIPWVDHWFVGEVDAERKAPVDKLMAVLREQGVLQCDKYDRIEDAYYAARAVLDPSKDRLLVFGSFYTVAAVQKLLRNKI